MMRAKVYRILHFLMIILINLVLEGDCDVSELKFVHGINYHGFKSRFQRQNENNNVYQEMNGYAYDVNGDISSGSGNDERSSLVSGYIDKLPEQPLDNVQANEINAAFNEISSNANGYNYEKPSIPFEPVAPGSTGGSENGNAPRYPSSPSAPAVPQYPSSPSAPEAPEYPSSPSAPEAPEYPSSPSAPQAPEYPNSPSAPEAPAYPSSPSVPNAPEQYPSSPNAPASPEYSSSPSAPTAPEYPSSPSAANFPSLSDYPGSPSVPSSPQYPDSTAPQTPGYDEGPGGFVQSSPSPFSPSKPKDSFQGYDYSKPRTDFPSPNYPSSPYPIPSTTFYPSSPIAPEIPENPETSNTVADYPKSSSTNVPENTAQTSATEKSSGTPSIAPEETPTGPYFSSSPSPFSLATTQQQTQQTTDGLSPVTFAQTPSAPAESPTAEESPSPTTAAPTTTDRSSAPPLIRTAEDSTQTDGIPSSRVDIEDDGSNIPLPGPEEPGQKFDGYDYPRPQNPMTYPPQLFNLEPFDDDYYSKGLISEIDFRINE